MGPGVATWSRTTPDHPPVRSVSRAAVGTGLTVVFSRVLVSEEGRMEEGSDLLGATPGAWGFARLGLGPGWAAAVAWRRPG